MEEVSYEQYLKVVDQLHSYSELYQKYAQARRIHQDIINDMMPIVEKENLTPNAIFMKYQTKPIYVDLQDQMEAQFFFDFLLYKYDSEVECLTERMLKTETDPEKREVLEAMLQSEPMVYRFLQRDEKDGLVTLENMYTHDIIQVVDGRLGMGQKPKSAYLVLRVVDYKDIKFQTGLTHIFSAQDGAYNRWVKSHAIDFTKVEKRVGALISTREFFHKSRIQVDYRSLLNPK